MRLASHVPLILVGNSNSGKMRIDTDNIAILLNDGIPVEVCASRFRHSQLLTMAQHAGMCETMLTICGIEKIGKDEYAQLRYAANGFLRIKVQECPNLQSL